MGVERPKYYHCRIIVYLKIKDFENVVEVAQWVGTLVV